MIIPTVPTFTTGDTSITNLQSLAACAGFFSCISSPTGSLPFFHCYRTTTQSISASTWTSVGFPIVVADTDGMSNGTGVTVVTQGYYAIDACLPFTTLSSGFIALCRFLFTAGTHNPHFTSGTQVIFGGRGSFTIAAVGYDEVSSVTDITPMVCYPGDTLNAQVFSTVAFVVDNVANATLIVGRYPPNFTGRWIRSGT